MSPWRAYIYILFRRVPFFFAPLSPKASLIRTRKLPIICRRGVACAARVKQTLAKTFIWTIYEQRAQTLKYEEHQSASLSLEISRAPAPGNVCTHKTLVFLDISLLEYYYCCCYVRILFFPFDILIHTTRVARELIFYLRGIQKSLWMSLRGPPVITWRNSWERELWMTRVFLDEDMCPN